MLAEDADHLNDEHGDTVTFVARFAGDWPDTRDASITAVDEDGVELELVLDDGSPTTPAYRLLHLTGGARGRPHSLRGRLLTTIEALETDSGGSYFFGAGESREMTSIRKHLRQGRSLPREQVQMTAYWRRS